MDIINKFGDKWTSPENIVTLGAYKLTDWDHDRMIILTRNDNYYGSKAKIKNIQLLMIAELKTALNMYDQGEIDVLDTLPPLEIRRLKNRPDFVKYPYLYTYFIGINVNKKPVNDPLVRQALAHAINKKEITEIVGSGEVPINGWLPTGLQGFSEDVGLKFSPEEARKKLSQAGYPEGRGFPKLIYAFNTNETHQRIAENIQAQLKRNLNIQIELKNEEWKVYLKNLVTDAYPLFRMGWVGDYVDPDTYMALMTSFSENNRGRYKSKVFDDLVFRALKPKDFAKRKALYDEAQRVLLEKDAAVIPLYSGVQKLMIARRVKNHPANILGRFIYKDTELIE
jgi:oligopeptide transport system substrate-binding protein